MQDRPLERIHIDILGPLIETPRGNQYVLVVVDQFTKWVECYALADQTANGSLEGLLDWVKVSVTNKSEVELHMLDRELLSAFCVFLGNLPRKEELSALLGWRMVYSIM